MLEACQTKHTSSMVSVVQLRSNTQTGSQVADNDGKRGEDLLCAENKRLVREKMRTLPSYYMGGDWRTAILG